MNQDQYISLIIKQLSESLSAEEEKQLSEWVSKDIANIKLKDKLSASWDKADHYKEDITLDEKDAWSNISAKLNKGASKATNPSEINIIPIWRRPLSIAASLLALITCSWFLLSDVGGQAVNYSTNANETLDITLPDGSLINLNENSQLAYVEEDGKRNVNLSGEAFFDVSHDAANPFVVKSNNTTTTVLGTQFNINASSNQVTKVSLFEGKVSFEVADQESTILMPGNILTYGKGENKTEVRSFENENAIAWKTKEFNFKNEKLETVIKTLETYLDIKLDVKLNGNACVFTGKFVDPNYDGVRSLLASIYEFSMENIKGKEIIIIKNCE